MQLLYTEAEAERLTQFSARSLRKARQEGKLPYVLHGRQIRYTMDDLRQFIDASRQTNEPAQPTRRVTSVRKSGKIVPFSARQ